jgi:hypothetical protein
MWNGYQRRTCNRKARDLIWKMRHFCLPIESKLRHWQLADATAEFCSACPNIIQNHSHLFWHCPIAATLWNSLWRLARIAWPDWRLCSNTLSYEDVLWELPARGFPNKEAAQAWDCYVECALRALWICRCNNKMSEGIFNVAKVVSTFLAFLATMLDMVLTDYRAQQLNVAEFIQDWCGRGRIASIDVRNGKLVMSWLQG